MLLPSMHQDFFERARNHRGRIKNFLSTVLLRSLHNSCRSTFEADSPTDRRYRPAAGARRQFQRTRSAGPLVIACEQYHQQRRQRQRPIGGSRNDAIRVADEIQLTPESIARSARDERRCGGSVDESRRSSTTAKCDHSRAGPDRTVDVDPQRRSRICGAVAFL